MVRRAAPKTRKKPSAGRRTPTPSRPVPPTGTVNIGVLKVTMEDGKTGAVLYAKNTMWTLSPIFVDEAEARAFLTHVRAKYGVTDPRCIGTAPLDDEFLRFVGARRERR